MEMIESEQKIAVVIGGAKGIGLEISRVLCEEGFQVIVASRNPPDVGHPQISSTDLDLTNSTSINHFLEKMIETLPYLNVLVNNAGVPGPTSPIQYISQNEWLDVFQVNVNGPFFISQGLLPLMEKAPIVRRIINIGSMTGKRPLYNRVPYAASKMALLGMTRTMALELGKSNITVNQISPGYVEGERINNVLIGQARARGLSAERVRDEFLDQSPLAKLVSPASIARMVAYLCSEHASDITGSDFGITAGVWMD